jgi:hypothetical protein
MHSHSFGLRIPIPSCSRLIRVSYGMNCFGSIARTYAADTCSSLTKGTRDLRGMMLVLLRIAHTKSADSNRARRGAADALETIGTWW